MFLIMLNFKVETLLYYVSAKIESTDLITNYKENTFFHTRNAIFSYENEKGY